MFNHLFDFGYQRSTKEALGFYIAYLVLAIVAAMLLGGVAGMIGEGDTAYELGVKIGSIVAVVASVVLSFLIIRAKRLYSFGMILLGIVSGLLALITGGLGGFIPVAYLSTRENRASAAVE
jgi:hypothetical protein